MSGRAVIYTRVSTDEQVKGYSLQTQVAACHAYAGERGYCITAKFTDDYTGASMDRPGLNQLREFIASSPTDVVIVYDIDRLARKSVYQMLIEEELNRAGARVEYVNGQYDDTDEGRLQKQIRASIAEYEKAKILERSKRGKRGKAQSGFVLVGARSPYGYRVNSEPHKAWLEIDEDEAKIVQMVYQWYVYGDGENGTLSIRGISIRLTELGVPTRGDRVSHVAKKRATTVWSSAMIRHILLNETYTGVWHYGKTQMVNDDQNTRRTGKSKRGLGKQVARPREEWIAVDVPAIISRDVFEQVQQQMVLNIEQSKRNTNKYQYLLGRRIRCTVCGYTYQGRTRRANNQYYCCHGRDQKPVSLCAMPNFRVDLVDKAVWQWLKNVMQHPESIALGLKSSQVEADRANHALRERLSLIESQLVEAESQLARLLDLYMMGEFAKELLLERKTRLESTMADLKREQTELTAHLKVVDITDEQIAEMQAFCEEVAEGLEQATFEDKRRYIDLLDVRAQLAVENNEKVAYVKCMLTGKQPVAVVVTSRLSNNHKVPPLTLTGRLVVDHFKVSE